ncbi:hypothetical protein ABW21_db0209436 [Orbilia brochopaga]|nr:hypothetical protein ABW21_db0209436 [Drechslerella brochopaga]
MTATYLPTDRCMYVHTRIRICTPTTDRLLFDMANRGLASIDGRASDRMQPRAREGRKDRSRQREGVVLSPGVACRMDRMGGWVDNRIGDHRQTLCVRAAAVSAGDGYSSSAIAFPGTDSPLNFIFTPKDASISFPSILFNGTW